MPKLQGYETTFIAQPQRIFPNKHLTSIHTINTTENEEYLLSADEVQAFMWSMEDPTKPFLVADLLLDQKVEDVKENITCAKMHPNSDGLFLYGSNKGLLKMADLRISLCDNTALSFKAEK